MPDYNDPAIEEQWCLARLVDVIEYLKIQGLQHGRVAEWPEWHLAPYASLWAIESLRHQNSVGWWAICGDLPTDYISAAGIDHPRKALRTIAIEWLEQAKLMELGDRSDAVYIGCRDNWSTLAPLLHNRASLLLKLADDDAYWDEVSTTTG